VNLRDGLESNDAAVAVRGARKQSVDPGVRANVDNQAGTARQMVEHGYGLGFPAGQAAPEESSTDAIIGQRGILEAASVRQVDLKRLLDRQSLPDPGWDEPRAGEPPKRDSGITAGCHCPQQRPAECSACYHWIAPTLQREESLHRYSL